MPRVHSSLLYPSFCSLSLNLSLSNSSSNSGFYLISVTSHQNILPPFNGQRNQHSKIVPVKPSPFLSFLIIPAILVPMFCLPYYALEFPENILLAYQDGADAIGGHSIPSVVEVKISLFTQTNRVNYIIRIRHDYCAATIYRSVIHAADYISWVFTMSLMRNV